MSHVVLDDHLLRDLLADSAPTGLQRILRTRAPATTNLYYLRLCRSVVAAAGGALTRSWSAERRRSLADALTTLPDDIRIVSMPALAFDMASLAADHGLSSLGAEAIAACRMLDAPLYVDEHDDGPRIRAAAAAHRIRYRTVGR
ncbi:MAG: hypothetical protein DHS20C19_17150 [Acidimicrobiales bacterium]|nr:MAG: hypothetical protein DHS20C19_17150 [Acidimicrobiales bacterium]